jgi:hypothetical protein
LVFARTLIAVLLILAISLTAVAAAGHLASQPTGGRSAAGPFVDTVLVDASHPPRVIPDGFFGINYVGFWDTAQGSPASARALAQTPIRTVRFAGGDPGDWYDWADPYYKGWSKTSPLDLWRWAKSFGARPLFQTNYQGHLPNPPGQSYAVNSPQNAAAWVAYDRKMGIPAAMEVGNEEDIGIHAADDQSFKSYVSAFTAQAAAMHHVDPHVMVLGPASTNEYYWWALDTLGTFLQGTGNKTGSGQVDGVSLHYYAGSSWAAIQRSIAQHDTRHLPVYLTEWNLGSSDANNLFTPTAGHALAIADILGAFAQSGLAGEDYFDIHGATGWGLLYGPNEYRPVDSPTPTYYAMALWSHMGNQVLPLVQSEDPSSVMSTYATRAADGTYQVMVINKQPTAETVKIQLDGVTPAGHDLSVASLVPVKGSVFDQDVYYDGAAMPSPQHPLPAPRALGRVRGSTISYSVPGFSAVVLSVDGATPSRRVPLSVRPNPSHAIAPPVLAFSANGSVSHTLITRGAAESLSATVKATQDAGTVLVDIEVYDPNGRRAFQYSQHVQLRGGVAATVSCVYKPPSSAQTGVYTYKIGLFGPTWTPLYTWNNDAATFSVT